MNNEEIKQQILTLLQELYNEISKEKNEKKVKQTDTYLKKIKIIQETIQDNNKEENIDQKTLKEIRKKINDLN